MRAPVSIGVVGTPAYAIGKLVDAVVRFAVRFAAGGTRGRISIWHTMRRTLEMEFGVRDAIEVAIDAVPGNRARRYMLRRWQLAYADGVAAFVEELGRWVPPSEGMIFYALRQGNPQELFAGAAQVAGIRSRQMRAVRNAVAGPCFSLVLCFGMVWYVASELLPLFRGQSDMTKWTSFARLGDSVAVVVYEYDVFLALGLVGGLCAGALVIVRWTGAGRRRLDAVAPFSFYRVVSGTAFLVMALELMKLGVDLNESTWKRLSSGASPYVRSRMDAIQMQMVRGGMGLGRAMRAAGTGFPDPELVAVAAALDGREGWHEELAGFVERWLEQSEESMKAAAAGVNATLVCICMFLVALVLSPIMQSFMHLKEVGS